MINIDFAGKPILITGGLGAIAEHILRKLAAAGATLIVVDIKSNEEAQKAFREWKIPPPSCIYFSADITD